MIVNNKKYQIRNKNSKLFHKNCYVIHQKHLKQGEQIVFVLYVRNLWKQKLSKIPLPFDTKTILS